MRFIGGQDNSRRSLAVDVTALTKLHLDRRVHGHAKGMDKIETIAPQRSDIVAEQRQNQRFVGFQDFEPQERNKANGYPNDANR